MKVLLICGSPRKNGCTQRGLEEVASALKANGIETEFYSLANAVVRDCKACGTCAVTGTCIIDDDACVNELTARLDEFDGFVIGSPVYYGAASGQVRSFLDRFFYSADKSKLQGKPGAAIVSCRRGGATAAFDELNKYFTISNMPVVSSNYWNQIHGNRPEEVEKDEEGLQTLRILGNNMAWLLKCIEAGKEKGIVFENKEAKIRTNFIR